MNHRHLSYPPGTPVEKWPVAALLDVLERGDLGDWRPIVVAVARNPNGPFAARVMETVNAYPMYGTSALWRAWIDRRRARAEGAMAPATPIALAKLRRRMGRTQVDIARRIGISQSDLSKLERRKDVRLSTLNAYAKALGGRLRLLLYAGTEMSELRIGASKATPRRRGRKPRRRAR